MRPLADAKGVLDTFWPKAGRDARVVHLVGKDILRFHTVYWPAFLLAVCQVLVMYTVVHFGVGLNPKYPLYTGLFLLLVLIGAVMSGGGRSAEGGTSGACGSPAGASAAPRCSCSTVTRPT